jgi:Mg2+-importing ATPase
MTSRVRRGLGGTASTGSDSLHAEAATRALDEVLGLLRSSGQGLTEEEAGRRAEEHGYNILAQEQRRGLLRRLLKSLYNPLVILLGLLATVSFVTGDVRAGLVMSSMIGLGVGLRFTQESRADAAAERLKAIIHVTATAVRDGRSREVPLRELVLGDVVRLSAGDLVPADVRLCSAKDLFVVQSALTGESLPMEKSDARELVTRSSPLEYRNLCFLGTSVQSGVATAVVVATGGATYLGGIAKAVAAEPPPTAFDKGVARFTTFMIRLMAIMIPLVFVINGLTKHDWAKAFFFALAVAVGLTPEMLPMIVSVCLSKGAMAMSRKQVIVKQLDSIQNLGAMDVLCTDKTGTLTVDRVLLQRHCNVAGQEDEDVLLDAYLISHFQSGLRNVLDRAILECREVHEPGQVDAYAKCDEVPFDFDRQIMSVVVTCPDGGRRLLAKGAPEAVFRRCTRFELDGEVDTLAEPLTEDLQEEHERLSGEGFRVLAVAYRDVDVRPAYSTRDECDLVLRGYVAFLDPPKDSARGAIEALRGLGVAVKVLTGDGNLVAGKVCAEVGLAPGSAVLGSDVEAMTQEQLARAAERVTLFARLSPSHKQRVIAALQAGGHVVGYLGDGINDAPALRAADVGVSVDTAVDVAKESADLILLEKSLLVLRDGVVEGRKVFVNILKYVRMGASSNFGNMFSVLGGSAFLPFLPMAPIQVLTNNLLYDFSQVPIPTDNVDAEQIARPRPWRIEEIRRFVLLVGPVSSVFDYVTFFVMLWAFGCWAADAYHASLFQTGWFVESLLTQTLVIHVIRTDWVPFLQSRASWPLVMTTLTIAAVGAWLPYSPLARPLGFVPLSASYWAFVLPIVVAYLGATQGAKVWLIRRGWI